MRKVLFFIFGIIMGISSQGQNSLSIIPTPQSTQREEGQFELKNDLKISTGKNNSKENLFAATQLIEECKSDLNFAALIESKLKKASVAFFIAGTDELPKEFTGGSDVLKQLGTEGYWLKVTPAKICIVANNTTGIFYGVQTLKQLIRSNRVGNKLNCLTITDWPALKYRGWMDDISRGPIPTVAFIKEVIKKMAEFKQNYFNLYTEHVFKLKSHPDIAPADGLTSEQISELESFAGQYHIELIGNQQCFGHMSHMLEIPFYNSISDNGWVLNPGTEKTYKFLDDLFGEVAPAYSNTLFNINCDETFGLGTGKAKAFVDSLGMEKVYAYHINRLNDILKKHNKQMMMWGDIAVHHKSIIDKLPKDLIILSWGYSAGESFENAIKPFSESGFKFMIAPGVSCWSQIYPSLSNAVVNISNYVRDGYRLGAMGMMNTCWDDDSENLFNYNWHGLTWGAECSWNPAKETEKAKATDERNAKLAAFNQSFDKVFYGLKEGSVTSLLFDMDKLRNLPIHGIMGDGAFWKNILEFYDEGNKQTVVSDNEKLIEETDAIIKGLNEMKEKARFNKATINYALFAAKRARFTGEKNIVTLSLQNAFTNNSTSDILAAQKAVAALKEKLGALRSEYVVLWNEENRGWWLDKVLAKYDELGNQLDALDKRVFITIGDKLPDNSFKVNLQTVYNDKPIYYTLDGTEPELTSARYDGNLKISKPTFIRTRVIENKARYDISSKEILVHKALGCMKQLNSTYSGYSPAYSAGGMGALTDGIRGSENFADGHWQAFQGQDLNCVIDLKKVTDINEISIGFYQNTSSWILMPSKIEFYKSDDGVHFTLSEVVNNTIDPKTEGTVIHNFMTSKKMKARFVKVIACSIGKLPAWHPSAGTDSFIFADEIIIN